ncbi:O-antigen ligase family protein [bacterium]|nr:O-antigen ligase family protein [bacterium]
MFFKQNENKIPAVILFVTALMSYESIIAIYQNMGGVVEISGWQDMSNINPEQVVSRAYGTLQPYNPNLLAGYLLCGLATFVYLILVNLKSGKKRVALVFLGLLLLNLIAIIDTGCRGAYLGFLFFFPVLFLALIYHVQRNLGGFENIKKRYKNLTVAGIVGIILFVVTNPALIKRVESIFALRADSSISFRMNVYEAVWKMFLDNPFLGIGVGNQNFREIYGLYMKTGYDALGSYCVPLEIAVESGIFALIVFIIFLILVIRQCFKVCKSEKNINIKVLALCIALVVFATMGHGLFDTIWFRPQVQFLFWTFVAMLKTDKLSLN